MRIGLLGMAEPVLAAVVAWIVLGGIVGGAVVLIGIVLAETARTTHPARSAVSEGVVRDGAV